MKNLPVPEARNWGPNLRGNHSEQCEKKQTKQTKTRISFPFEQASLCIYMPDDGPFERVSMVLLILCVAVVVLSWAVGGFFCLVFPVAS